MHDVEHTAMGDHQNPISRVLACNIVQRVMHPPGEDGEAFTLFWQGEFELTLGETMIELGVLVLGFGVGQALEQTVVTLTQAHVVGRNQSLPAHDGGGGLARALQVAAVHGGEALTLEFKMACGVFGLSEACLVERDVDMALKSALCVPGGFAVAYEADRAAR